MTRGEMLRQQSEGTLGFALSAEVHERIAQVVEHPSSFASKVKRAHTEALLERALFRRFCLRGPLAMLWVQLRGEA